MKAYMATKNSDALGFRVVMRFFLHFFFSLPEFSIPFHVSLTLLILVIFLQVLFKFEHFVKRKCKKKMKMYDHELGCRGTQ